MDRSEGPRSARYRRRLYRGYLWIALVPFSFFVVLGAAAIFLTQSIVIKELSSLKERNLRQVAENIELWFGEADSIALGLSTDPEFSRGAEYLLKTGIPSHTDLKLSKSLQSVLASAVNSRLYLHSITVITDSSSGLIITSMEGLAHLADYPDAEWLDGTKDHMGEITPWYLVRDFHPLPNFPLSIPILSFYRNMLGTGSLERKGVLAVNVDLRKLDALLEKSAEAAGGRFMLVDKASGKIVAGLRPDEDEASMAALLPPSEAAAPTAENTATPVTAVAAAAFTPLKLVGGRYFATSRESERFPFAYYLLSPAEEFRRIPRRVMLIGGALASLALAVGIALALALARRNFRLLDGILDIVEAAGQGKPLPPFRESRNEALDYVSLAVLKTFVEHDYYKIRLSERELRQRTLELTALQAQMNPHFLFNTLTTIAFKAMQLTGGKNDLSDMVKQLSDMLAYSLADAKVPATLGAEFAHARRYAELQRRRFGDRFSCECVEDPELSAVPCIKLILQPLVENAFEHGFSDKERGGAIRVGASRDQGSGRLRLVVEDDGIGMAEERLEELRALIAAGAESAEHVGLVNTARRLSLAYGAKASCVVESWPGRGTKITLLFPDAIPAAFYPGSSEAESFD